MGAEAPTILKSRRATCKCDICGRGFLSVQALRTHQSFTHPKSRQRVAYKPSIEVLAERNLMSGKVVKAIPMPVKDKYEEENGPTKLEFGCPKCSKVFSAYFHAFKHIQKNHSVNHKGEAVTSSSPEKIKPVRIVTCLACNLNIGFKKHHCTADEVYVNLSKSGLKCLSCKKEFSKILLFDAHITGLHSDDVQTMFFPTSSDFTAWKRHMEVQMQCSYIMISEFINVEKSGRKQVYRCPYYSPNFHEEMTGFCPSSVFVQEFPKGYQVHFYKEHYGHIVKPYKLDKAYKKHSISHLMIDNNILPKRIKTEPTPAKESDMYVDFKQLMVNIILEAEKVDDNCLKNLYGKALEMSILLNDQNESKNTLRDSKSVVDDDRNMILSKVETRSKRKQDLSHTLDPAKKPKTEELENSLKKNNSLRSPINFNDTFKDFVGNIGCNVSDIEKNGKRKDVVKTKMGQFKPSPPKVQKKESVKTPIKSPVAKIESDIIYDLSKVKSEFKFDLSKVKTEIEYEVREQENDCNILILKI